MCVGRAGCGVGSGVAGGPTKDAGGRGGMCESW